MCDLFLRSSVAIRSFTLSVACCSDLPNERCDIHLWYLDLLTDGVFGDHMTARQRSIVSKIERMIATKEAHVDVNCRLLRIYETILRVRTHDGISPTAVKYAEKIETGTDIEDNTSKKYFAKSDMDNAQVDNDRELVVDGEDTLDSSIGKVSDHLKENVEVHHPLDVEESEDQFHIEDDSLERESSAEESENTEDDSVRTLQAVEFRVSNDPSANEAEHVTNTIAKVSGSSQDKVIRSFARDTDTTSSIIDMASSQDTNRQPEIDETKTELSDSERTRVTTIDEEPVDLKSIVELSTTDERVGTQPANSNSDSRNIPAMKGGESDGYVITDINESPTLTNEDPTDSTFDGDNDNSDELGSEHRPPYLENTGVTGPPDSGTAIEDPWTHLGCNEYAHRRRTYDTDCLMTHAFLSTCLAFCHCVSLFHSLDDLKAVKINAGANNPAERTGHPDSVDVSSCSTKDAFAGLTAASKCEHRLQTKHDPTTLEVFGGEIVREQCLDSQGDLIHLVQSAHSWDSAAHTFSPFCGHIQASSSYCDNGQASSPSSDHSQTASTSCDHSQASSPSRSHSQVSSPSCGQSQASSPSYDNSQASSPSCDHSQESSTSCAHIHASSPFRDHIHASSPSRDHIHASSPCCDNSQATFPSCDHIQASSTSCAHIHASSPFRDHIHASSPSRDHIHASSPSRDHIHASSPFCDNSQASSTSCDHSQASLERLEAASKECSKDYDRKIDILEMQMLRLENRILLETISHNEDSATILKLENKVLWLDHRVQQMCREMEAKQDDKPRKQNDGVLVRNIEVMGDRFLELTKVLDKQSARIRHLEERVAEWGANNRAIHKTSLKHGIRPIAETEARGQFNFDTSDQVSLLPPDIVVQDREGSILDSGRPETGDSHVLLGGMPTEPEVNERHEHTSDDILYDNAIVSKQTNIEQNESSNNSGETERVIHMNSITTLDNANNNHDGNLITPGNYKENVGYGDNGISETASVMQNRQRIIKQSDTPYTRDTAADGTTKDDNTLLELEHRRTIEHGMHIDHRHSWESPHTNKPTGGSGSDELRPKFQTPQNKESMEELSERTRGKELNVKARQGDVTSNEDIERHGEPKKIRTEQQDRQQRYQQHDTTKTPAVTTSQLNIGDESDVTKVKEQHVKEVPTEIRSELNTHRGSTSTNNKRTGEDEGTQESRIRGVLIENSVASVKMAPTNIGAKRPLATNTDKPVEKRKGKRHQFKIPEIPKYTKRGYSKPKGRQE